MRFTKMHGIGNDYVYIDGFKVKVEDPVALAKRVSNRNFGVGSDGLILILPSDKADVRMRMFNADGSESEMCGNGIRCVAKYSYDHGLSKANPIRVETGNGVLTLQLHTKGNEVERVTVDMGEPILDLPKVPVDPSQVSKGSKEHAWKLEIPGHGSAEATFVSMGNPHATIFVPEVASVDLNKIGPLVEHHKAFPRRINAHWVQVNNRQDVTMRTWERGSGITLACGTGASAVCVSAVLMGLTERKITAHLPGGDLELEWRASDNHVYMTGAATEVFSGELK